MTGMEAVLGYWSARLNPDGPRTYRAVVLADPAANAGHGVYLEFATVGNVNGLPADRTRIQADRAETA